MNYTVIFIVDHLPKDYQELHPSGRLLADENRSEPCARVKSWDHLLSYLCFNPILKKVQNHGASFFSAELSGIYFILWCVK